MASPFIGQISTYGFSFPPRNWALAQGQILSIAQNTALFSLLGTTYGGNGQTTFALPDLQGRVVLGQGSGPGLTSRTIGEVGGTETTTLLSTQMPQHVHSLSGVTGTLSAINIKATEQNPPAGGYLARGVDTAPQPDSIPEIYLPASVGDPATKVPLAGVNVAGNTQIAGGSQPFSTMQPYLVLNQCIALTGIFPSRN
jgi:microcystin-dependent protein